MAMVMFCKLGTLYLPSLLCAHQTYSKNRNYPHSRLHKRFGWSFALPFVLPFRSKRALFVHCPTRVVFLWFVKSYITVCAHKNFNYSGSLFMPKSIFRDIFSFLSEISYSLFVVVVVYYLGVIWFLLKNTIV